MPQATTDLFGDSLPAPVVDESPRYGFAQVAVPKPLHGLFDYALTAASRPPIGARVRVPFGQTEVIGICLGYTERSDIKQVKPVREVLDPEQPALNATLCELARWLATYYHYPIGEVCQTLLPAAARRGAELTLVRERAWRVVIGPLPNLRRAPSQAALTRLLRANSGQLSDLALRNADISRAALQGLRQKGLITPVDIEPVATQLHLGPTLSLTDEQRLALTTILADQQHYATHLLDGITGSGKTEVYLQAMAAVLAAGRQVLVLVPEIALTPQTLARFRARFGSAVALHSQISDTQRLQIWLRCQAGLEPVLIGTRSAILAPFRDLGLIVVDEEHDPSYKQAEGLRYSARDLAVKRARDLQIPLVLGSATPALESLHNAAVGRYHTSHLRERPAGARLPSMRVVDIRGVPLIEGLAPEVISAIDSHLRAGNQALIFINRRGFAPTYLCLGCQWQACCVHCEARLTLHHQGSKPRQLRCHHCGARAAVPQTCPSCASTALIPVGAGTQRTEQALAERFPDVPMIRVDRDTTRTATRLAQQLAIINEGQPSLLVGTQMLAKGHHFPAVTLVAIVDADSGFLAADYRAPERTAALITQVAGRAGRAERPGEVLIQSLHPENEVLTALINGGFAAFAAIELRNREAGGLPPFAPIALLRADGLEPAAPDALLKQLVAPLVQQPGITVLGPAPAPLSRMAGRFRSQTLITASDRATLHRALRVLLTHAPPSRHGKLSWSLDVDPYDTY